MVLRIKRGTKKGLFLLSSVIGIGLVFLAKLGVSTPGLNELASNTEKLIDKSLKTPLAFADIPPPPSGGDWEGSCDGCVGDI